MVIGFRQRIATLHGLTLQQVETTKCLGLTIDQFLTRGNHFQSVKQKVGCSIIIFKTIRPFIGLEHLLNVYRSILQYCLPGQHWSNVRTQSSKVSCKIGPLVLLKVLHTPDIQLISGMKFSGWYSLTKMRQLHTALMMFKVNHGPPTCLESLTLIKVV